MKKKTSQKFKKNNDEIRKTVLFLLDKNDVTKAEIVEQIEKKYNISKAEIRNIVREIKTDFITKLNVLQSGMIKV